MKRISWRFWILLGLAILVYIPAIRGGFIWDDEAYVTENLFLRTIDGIWKIWTQPQRMVQFYPLTFTSFWIEYRFWGLNPMGYHITNVLLHSLNAFLLWRLLEKLKVRGSWLAALIFLLHPVHVESVAWVTERKNVLSGFFYLSAFISYLRFREEVKFKPWYFISYGFFLFALLSKTVTATFPAALLVVLWWREKQTPLKDAVRLIPFFITGGILGTVAAAFETGHIVSMGADEWAFSLSERILIAGRALWFYVGKLIWPHPLIFTYPRWEINPSDLRQWLFPFSFGVLLIILWAMRRNKTGIFAGFLCFILTLFPALGFKSYFPMRFSFVADHFQYLASIGLITLAASAIKTRPKQLKIGLMVTLLIFLGSLSFKQTMIYKDLETLWRDTLAKNPKSWMAHNNLGVVMMQDGRYEEATPHFKEGINIKPDDAEAFNNLGGIMATEGKLDEAIGYFKEAIRYQPNAGEYYSNLCGVLIEINKIDEAISQCNKSMEYSKHFPDSRFNLGNAALKKGDIDTAISWYREAIDLDPNYADSYFNLGNVLSGQGRLDDSIQLTRKALELNPNSAPGHNNLADALAKKDELNEADLHYREAIRLDPGSVIYRNNYGWFLSGQGRTDEAIDQYNEVIQLEPHNQEAQVNLQRLIFQGFGQSVKINRQPQELIQSKFSSRVSK